MELTLEAVALFALKLVHEQDGGSPILRDDPVMVGYDREVFGLLVRQADLAAILVKVDECVGQALVAVGGIDTVLPAPLATLKDYLKDIQ